MFDDTSLLKELNNFSGCSKNSQQNIKGNTSFDSVDEPINAFENRTSILLMKQKLENVGHFSLKAVLNRRITEELS